MSRHPSVKWAQRSDKLFITLELPDAQDVKLKLQPEGNLFFSATTGADNIRYEVHLDLLDKVNVDESKPTIGLRNICFLVKKAEIKWWSRLLKQKGKPPVFLTVDWDKWVEENEEMAKKLQAPAGMEFDFDFSSLSCREGLDGSASSSDDDDDSDDTDTEEENVEEAPSAEEGGVPSAENTETAVSGSSEPDVKKT